jgi:hypothetical protein
MYGAEIVTVDRYAGTLDVVAPGRTGEGGGRVHGSAGRSTVRRVTS